MFVCSECGASQAGGGHCGVDGTLMAPIGEDILLGMTIGAYRVARLLGIGGMGRVYKGVHPTIGSRVAIKVLSRECSDRRDLVERFFAEAKAVNLIRHESIVNVLDLAMLPDGRPYIIMEYLDGAPLSSIVEHSVQTRMPLPLGGLARLAVEVLDALAAAHGKGIVHRDLKPDNVFVTPSGRPKVLDFGIAKLNDMSTGSATRTGSLLGTPHYMSPEQAAGKPADHRADVYAMGVILFECATGQKPFLAESLFELLRMHVEVPPPPPRSLRGDLGPELEAVILTALAKAPAQRFASAQAMSVALQHATSQLAAEQWIPITGSGAHRAVPTGGWQPTPPASWGGTGPTRGATGAPVQPPMIGSVSTVSASSGQVQRQPPARSPSKKGLWIAVVALVLVGGIVTAAVVAGGGDGSGSSVAAVEPAKTEPAKTEPAKTEPAKTEPAKAEAKPPKPPKPPIGSDAAEIDPDDILGEAMKQLDGMDPNMVPPEVRKQLDELKKMGKLTPAQQREKRKLLGRRGPATTAEADDPPGGAAPPPPKAAWVTSRDLPGPAGFDPAHLDVSAFIRYAMTEARKADPDAVLFRIDVDSVGPDGFANLELPSVASRHGSLDLRFFSPARSKRDPKVPLGVPVEWNCEFRIEAEPGGVAIRPISGLDCSKNIPITAPRCTAKALWQRAIAKKAPTNAVASLGYRAWSGNAKWYFDIGSGLDKVFSNVFDDGC